MTSKLNHHYFVTSADTWTSGSDLYETMARHKANTSINRAVVYLVPLPDNAPYEINFYKPQVEGIVLLGCVGYTAKERKKMEEENLYPDIDLGWKEDLSDFFIHMIRDAIKTGAIYRNRKGLYVSNDDSVFDAKSQKFLNELIPPPVPR